MEMTPRVVDSGRPRRCSASDRRSTCSIAMKWQLLFVAAALSAMAVATRSARKLATVGSSRAELRDRKHSHVLGDRTSRRVLRSLNHIQSCGATGESSRTTVNRGCEHVRRGHISCIGADHRIAVRRSAAGAQRPICSRRATSRDAVLNRSLKVDHPVDDTPAKLIGRKTVRTRIQFPSPLRFGPQTEP
jgi:hypothetical protein